MFALVSTVVIVRHISWHLDHPASVPLDNDIGLVGEGDVLRAVGGDELGGAVREHYGHCSIRLSLLKSGLINRFWEGSIYKIRLICV